MFRDAPPVYPGSALADQIRNAPWSHPAAATLPQGRQSAAVMDDEQYRTFKRMLARKARERRKKKPFKKP